METKSNPLVDENQPNSLLKQRVNDFLINYFNYSALVIAFIIFAAGLFWFAYPEYQSITKNNETATKNLQTEYSAKYDYLTTVVNLKNLYQQISEADRQKIEEMVPVDNNVVGQIPKIESIILSNNAILSSIKIEPVDSPSPNSAKIDSGEKPESPEGIFNGPLPEGVKLVKIEIDLGSVDYQVLKNIIKAFENNLRLYDVAKVDYAVQEKKTVLIIYSYYLNR